MNINNPILRGFNPDPCMIRVGDDYYTATSTFQWWPGVQIHHSRDLVNWRVISQPLNRMSQLDLRGVDDSCGVWAPCISYHEGIFYLIYTNVLTCRGIFKDTHNYMVTTDDIYGDWSDPIYLNSSGFDPSIFHDQGKHYILNMVWDSRKTERVFGKFAGIFVQEYDKQQKKLIGKPVNIFKGTQNGCTEGPNMYKKDGYYYLMCAEGGTGRTHVVTLARSKTLFGQYELHPQNPILTSKDNPELELQRAGHASLVDTQNGEWYLAHLASRPVVKDNGDFRSIMGRETCIQKVEWRQDGWLYLCGRGNTPQVNVPAPNLTECKWETYPERNDFDSQTLSGQKLPLYFQTLRQPLPEELCSLTQRKGYLRLRGAESMNSKFLQSLVARRQQSFRYQASTCLEFEPENFLQSAGLTALYDTEAYYYLRVTWDEDLGKCLSVLANDSNNFTQTQPVKWNGGDRIYLKAVVDYEELRFYYSEDGESESGNWIQIGDVYDVTVLSDEYGSGGHFTGAFVGICAQDLGGTKCVADFDWFEYKEL